MIFLTVIIASVIWLNLDSSSSDNTDNPSQTASPAPAEVVRPITTTEIASQQNLPAAPEKEIEVSATTEQQLIGQRVRVREFREDAGSGDNGPLRNLEFVFRQGINPRRLFEHNDRVILRYEPFYQNQVGTGAATYMLYYELVTQDTNGDGELSAADKLAVAVSWVDGSDLTILASGLDEVLAYEHEPSKYLLHLSVRIGEARYKQTYSLTEKDLVHQEVLN